jgi:hypothetical protein
VITSIAKTHLPASLAEGVTFEANACPETEKDGLLLSKVGPDA